MSRYVDAEYIKAVMLNDRLMQGNAEFTLYAQQVETRVNALPAIEIIRCRECKYTDGEPPIADGRSWCVLNGCFMYYCSDGCRSEKPTSSTTEDCSDVGKE